MDTPQESRSEVLVARITLAGSVVLTLGLAWVYALYNSQLAFAQAADSFLDVFTSAVISWTVSISARPEDLRHPYGYTRAEPIGALVVAVVTGVLAFEVLQNAFVALYTGARPRLSGVLIIPFVVKIVFKSGIAGWASRLHARRPGPALSALMIDARNDVAVSSLAVVGYFAARYGWGALDAWLAFPIGLWIGWAGFDLALSNVRLLMGVAPPQQRQEELVELACGVPKVLGAHDLRAHYLGTALYVNVHVIVEPALTVGEGHDIGEEVRSRLEREPDVLHCSVHVDIA